MQTLSSSGHKHIILNPQAAIVAFNPSLFFAISIRLIDAFILCHRSGTLQYEAPARFEVSYEVICSLFWPHCRPFNGIVPIGISSEEKTQLYVAKSLDKIYVKAEIEFSHLSWSRCRRTFGLRGLPHSILHLIMFGESGILVSMRVFHRKITVALINVCAIPYLGPDIALRLLFFCVELTCQMRQLVFKQ